jgi:hypothetical protein
MTSASSLCAAVIFEQSGLVGHKKKRRREIGEKKSLDSEGLGKLGQGNNTIKLSHKNKNNPQWR